MKRILLTGMSGTGKSTLITTLAARGYWAVDADCDEYSEWIDTPEELGATVDAGHDWVWRADRMRELLASEHAEVLFVSGCAANMGQFLSQFDQIVLLSAPAHVIVERLRTRTNNSYGKQPEEVARVLALRETIEPLLRRIAGHEIDTNAPLDEIMATLMQFV